MLQVIGVGFGRTGTLSLPAYWRDLTRHYPEAKVILTVRDPGCWYQSARATIFQSHNADFAGAPPELAAMRDVARRIVWEGVLGGRIDEDVRRHAQGTPREHRRLLTASRPRPPSRRSGRRDVCERRDVRTTGVSGGGARQGPRGVRSGGG